MTKLSTADLVRGIEEAELPQLEELVRVALGMVGERLGGVSSLEEQEEAANRINELLSKTRKSMSEALIMSMESLHKTLKEEVSEMFEAVLFAFFEQETGIRVPGQYVVDPEEGSIRFRFEYEQEGNLEGDEVGAIAIFNQLAEELGRLWGEELSEEDTWLEIMPQGDANFMPSIVLQVKLPISLEKGGAAKFKQAVERVASRNED